MRRLIGLSLVLCMWPAAAHAADPPDPGKTDTFQYGSGDAAFPYIVYTPKSVDPARSVPLLVMTHGCQTSAEQQMRANLYNPVAEREKFIVLYPDIDKAGTQQPGPLRNCWRFFNPESWHRDQGDAAVLAGMTREVMKRSRVDAERVYLMGMSAGGFMTSILAAAYPDIYAAVGIMSAGAYADPSCLFGNPATKPAATSAQEAYAEMGPRARVVPRLVMGGDKDSGVPPACHDKALEQGLRTNNLVISGGSSQDGPIPLNPSAVREEPKAGGYPSTVRTYRDPDGCVVGERWVVHGMNHFWSGGSSDPKWASFTDPKGPSGVEVSWRFFKRYTKSATAMPCATAPCPKTTISIRLPAGTVAASATVDGKRVTGKIKRGSLLLTVPPGLRETTAVKIRARKASGRKVTRRYSYAGCGPARA
jgi:poly(hydroxyalkanoate) depolymerase family esterase